MRRWVCMGVLAWAACGGDDGGGSGGVCDPGATRACTCTDGRSGSQACFGDGTGFESCTCSGPTTDGGPVLDAAPGPVDGGPGGCTFQFDSDTGDATDTCTGDNLCVCPGAPDDECVGTGTCSIALGRRYTIGVVAAAMPTPNNPAGGCWDLDCSPPDTFVQVLVDDVVIGETTATTDVNEVTYDPPFSFSATLAGGSQIVAYTYDEDITGDEPGSGCMWDVTAELLRGRLLICDLTDGTVIVAGVIAE